MIDQVARAMFTAFSRSDMSFDDLPTVVQEGYREMAEAAVARLQREIDGWRDVAESRFALVEQLKIENRQLKHELDRLIKHGAMSNVTRIHVIGSTTQEFFADDWEAHFQDDGRTLKLFGFGDGKEAKAERDSALGGALIEGFKDVKIYADRIRAGQCLRCGAAPGEHDCGREKS